MNAIAAAAQQGKEAAKIARTDPLACAVEALTQLETSGTPKGKLVITPGSHAQETTGDGFVLPLQVGSLWPGFPRPHAHAIT